MPKTPVLVIVTRTVTEEVNVVLDVDLDKTDLGRVRARAKAVAHDQGLWETEGATVHAEDHAVVAELLGPDYDGPVDWTFKD